MSFSVARVRHCLQTFDFKTLFIQELGWDKHSATLPVSVDDKTFPLQAVAEKRGMQVFECPAAGQAFPDSSLRRKVERLVAKSAHEHIIIYTDSGKTVQTWQWAKREQGRLLACREHTFNKSQPGDKLIQKLQHLAVTLEEEPDLSLVDVTSRTRQAFDVDRVTKRFYDRFKTQHAAFLDFIKGIKDKGDKEWYASLMLNRLMFVYFIQKKSFLDNDIDYLRNRLTRLQQTKGKGKFLGFYRSFLRRLFHEGLGQPGRSSELDELLGNVPFVNGGLFEEHELEIRNPEIKIADEAFEGLFDFFDGFDWTLEPRPPSYYVQHPEAKEEINPDVLGYIFEKYINQKQMGAYYTKEDITGYIARNTVIPFLFDAAEKKCAIAFKPESAVWRLLQDDPDRYIYPAMGHGIFCDIREAPPRPLADPIPLPTKIGVGLNNVSKREDWNKAADPELALPTESWREHVARRQRCEELRVKLKAGGIHSINDLISYNLNIEQFAEDVIENCEGPDLLRAFFRSIAGHIPEKSNEKYESGISILDPACGSGAFLFAALNILEPLYDACLDRMEAFVADLEHSRTPHHPEKFADFRKVLAELNDPKKHPSRRYFILKSIIIGNLYGVDIMEEAVEICKLRLFLKLVAQVEKVKHLEPLPDIDFNIRAGNSLVGFTTLKEIETAFTHDPSGQGKLLTSEDHAQLRLIQENAEVADRAFRMFRAMQTQHGMDAKKFSAAKVELRKRLDSLRGELDRYLACEYGVDAEKPKKFEPWRDTHQPFHWFAEFYGIMTDGGFDVIIGNPPYVEYRKVVTTYRIELCHFDTESAQNLYAFVVERSGDLLKDSGRFGMIIPSSAFGLDETACLREVIFNRYTTVHGSSYSIRPSKLFEGVDQRLCMIIADATNSDSPCLFTTRYHHWNAEERPQLFATLAYLPSFVHERLKRIAQLGDVRALGVLSRIETKSSTLLRDYLSGSDTGFLAHYHRSPRYWIRAMDFEQYFKSATRSRSVHHFRDLWFRDENDGSAACAIINSALFFFWFMAICNGRNLTNTDVGCFPAGCFDQPSRRRLAKVFAQLMENYKDNSFVRKRTDCEYQEFRPSMSKTLIDKIDSVLAKHYGFTDEELDFIINYDIKYRMGQEADTDADD